jgi:thymidine kinase
MPKILAVSDEIISCKADCDNCESPESATRSICLLEKDGQILVGADEAYRPGCPECWTAGLTPAT